MADRIGVNANTLRRWLIQYENFLVIRKDRKMKYIHEKSTDTLLLIKGFYEEFKKEHEIIELLVANPTVIRTMEGEEIPNEETIEESTDTELTILDEVAELKAMMNKQMEFNKQLSEQLHKQQQYIETKLEERDRVLMESLRQSQEEKIARIEAAATEKRGFFSRLFKG